MCQYSVFLEGFQNISRFFDGLLGNPLVPRQETRDAAIAPRRKVSPVAPVFPMAFGIVTAGNAHWIRSGIVNTFPTRWYFGYAQKATPRPRRISPLSIRSRASSGSMPTHLPAVVKYRSRSRERSGHSMDFPSDVSKKYRMVLFKISVVRRALGLTLCSGSGH